MKTKKIVAIDADIPCYSIGFASEGDPVEYALHSVKVLIKKCVKQTGADDYILFLTGKNNFRIKRATLQPYKGNRKGDKPTHHAAIRQYMIEQHGAVVIDDAEADDALGIFLTEEETGVEKVIATLDKDLDGVPGEHYNWKKNITYNVSVEEADEFFCQQLLTGDATDNIPGLFKLTGQRATKAVKARLTEAEGFKAKMETALSIFTEHRPDNDRSEAKAWIDEIGDLLWMQRDGAVTFEEYYQQQPSKAAINRAEVIKLMRETAKFTSIIRSEYPSLD